MMSVFYDKAISYYFISKMADTHFSKITPFMLSQELSYPFNKPENQGIDSFVTCLKLLMDMETEFRLSYAHFSPLAYIMLNGSSDKLETIEQIQESEVQ